MYILYSKSYIPHVVLMKQAINISYKLRTLIYITQAKSEGGEKKHSSVVKSVWHNVAKKKSLSWEISLWKTEA